MSYKVNYYTLAINKEGKVGNIKQEVGTVYTDREIKDIPEILNKHLKKDSRQGFITNIEEVRGVCI